MTHVTPEEDTNQVLAQKQKKFWDELRQASESMQYVLHRGTTSDNFIDNLPFSDQDKLTEAMGVKVIDRFSIVWELQEKFMQLLHEKRGLPAFPVDITSKAGQKVVKETIRDCADELFEAGLVLKNAKNHRATEFKEFDREHFIEECVDAHKFLLEVLVFAGVSEDEYYDAFLKKTAVNNERINGSY